MSFIRAVSSSISELLEADKPICCCSSYCLCLELEELAAAALTTEEEDSDFIFSLFFLLVNGDADANVSLRVSMVTIGKAMAAPLLGVFSRICGVLATVDDGGGCSCRCCCFWSSSLVGRSVVLVTLVSIVVDSPTAI